MRYLVVADCEGERRIIDVLPTFAKALVSMNYWHNAGFPMLCHSNWRIEERMDL